MILTESVDVDCESEHGKKAVYGREKEGKREGAARVLKDARAGLRPSKALKLFHQHDTKALLGSGNVLVEFLPLKSPKYT